MIRSSSHDKRAFDSPFNLSRIVLWGLLLAILVAFGAWGFSHLDGFSWSWDEGLLIATARSLDAGYTLYKEIWFDYPPLFPFLLRLSFHIGSDPIQAARGLIVICSLITLSSTAWISYQISHSHLASLGAVIMLLFTPTFVANSRAALADLPALTLAALALAATLYGKEAGSSAWFAGAGLLYGTSLAIKPTSYFIIFPILVLLWTRDGNTPTPLQNLTVLARRLLFVAGGCGIGLFLSFAWVPVGAFLQQMLEPYLSAHQNHGIEFAENLQQIWRYFVGNKFGGSQYGLFALGTFGFLAMLHQKKNPRVLAILVWWGTGLVVWLSHTPLYDHQLITLLLPLVILAALGTAELITMVSNKFKPFFLCILGICSLWLYLLSCPTLLEVDMGLAHPPEDDENQDALLVVQELEHLTNVDDFIITDSHMIASYARRNIPPEMVNVSSRRIKSNQLTAQKAIAWTEQYQPAAIIFWNDRLESMTDYVPWVQAHYRLARWFGKERRIYLPLSPPEHPTTYAFGDEITLMGYTWDSTIRRLSLYWRAETQPRWDYTLQITFLDKMGKDSKVMHMQLAEGDLSPSHWQKGDIIVTDYTLAISDGRDVAISVSRNGHQLDVFDSSGKEIADCAIVLENGHRENP